MTFDLDMRHFVLINKWGFLCCIYDPTLVEIHQSMWKIEPNVKLFSQQTTPDNTREQSDSYVSFLQRQATQKNAWAFFFFFFCIRMCNAPLALLYFWSNLMWNSAESLFRGIFLEKANCLGCTSIETYVHACVHHDISERLPGPGCISNQYTGQFQALKL